MKEGKGSWKEGERNEEKEAILLHHFICSESCLQTNRRCVLYKLHLLCEVNKLFSIVNNAPHDLSLDDNIESR